MSDPWGEQTIKRFRAADINCVAHLAVAAERASLSFAIG
jgi:hypothetical protein